MLKENRKTIYLFIYLSIFELSLHVVKDCLTNKYQRNKQKKIGFRNHYQIWHLISNEFRQTN